MSVGWYLFGDNILSWKFSNYTVELVAILLLSEARLGLVFRKKILLIFMSSGNRKNYKRFLEKHRFGTPIFRAHSR